MSKRKTVSRREILQAIRTENLRSGEFVETDLGTPLDDPNCGVCAVGSVLRKVGFDNSEIDIFGRTLMNGGKVISDYESYDPPIHTQREIDGLLERRLYLNALSVKFERQVEKTGEGKTTRKILAKFVKKHFPKRISLDPYNSSVL